MTPSEFRAWLEGFEEAFVDGRPTTEQWAKIKAKVGGLAEKEVRVFTIEEDPEDDFFVERYHRN